MKIGTISLNINAPDFNYGAVLHSWAFQQYLKKRRDVEYTEIIDYTMPMLEGQIRSFPVLDAIIHGHPKKAVRNLIRIVPYHKRLNKFDSFIKNQLTISEKKYIQSTLDCATLDYDTVVCESDVTWAAGFCGGHFDKSFFMNLRSMSNMKKIAYAPSMSDGEMTKEQQTELAKLLKNIDFISARESYEVDILQKHTEKKVVHVVDPVMLLNSEDYKTITAQRLIQKKYLLMYLPVDDNKNLRDKAKDYADKYGLQLVEISTSLTKSKDANIRTFTSAGVEEFLSLIKYSDMVFTNSFHGICFSIIFNKQFYAFSRRYAGKVADVCQIFNLMNRYFADDSIEEQPDIDYSVVNSLWTDLKNQSLIWIDRALNA